MTRDAAAGRNGLRPQPRRFNYDIFLSHASEDKKSIVGPLVRAMRKVGLRVWYDEDCIGAGDSIRGQVEDGLRSSRFVVVVLTKRSLEREGWVDAELSAAFLRDKRERQRKIIPIWHGVDADDVAAASPLLLDLRAIISPSTPMKIAAEVLARVRRRAVKQDQRPDMVNQKLASVPTIWVLGSFSELTPSHSAVASSLTDLLGAALPTRGFRLVMGDSDLLQALAKRAGKTAVAVGDVMVQPMVLRGMVRGEKLGALFQSHIGGLPDAALVLGGGVSRGRVLHEYQSACSCGVPVLPVPATGGAAAELKPFGVKLPKSSVLRHSRDAAGLCAEVLAELERVVQKRRSAR